MKTQVAIGVLLLIVFAFFFRTRSGKSGVSTQRPDVYDGLRAQVLHAKRSTLGLPPSASTMTPWAVVMDWGVERGSTTVVALSDGNASIYLSSGGGYLGGSQSHESIRKAAQNAVATAADLPARMRLTTTYPLPHKGEVIFYLLTDDGVFTAGGAQTNISGDQQALSKLGNAMQQIITEYRRIK